MIMIIIITKIDNNNNTSNNNNHNNNNNNKTKTKNNKAIKITYRPKQIRTHICQVEAIYFKLKRAIFVFV